jgi:hypothetical protein
MTDRYTLTPLEYGAPTITEYRDDGMARMMQREAEAQDYRDRQPPPADLHDEEAA